MGFFDDIADKFDDAKRSAKRSVRKAKKKTNSDSGLEAAGKIAGKAIGHVVGVAAVTAAEIGTEAFNVANKKAGELQALKAEMSEYDDERIMHICKHSCGLKKMAALSILKERGYDLRRH